VGNTVAIHSVLKKTIKLNFQPAQYLKNQINKNNSAKKKENFGKKIKNKKIEKKHVEKAKAKFSTSSILKK
jgi:hypothetical protein